MRASPAVVSALLLVVANGCLVQRPAPEPPPATAAHETRRTAYPDGSLRRELRLLVWSDGRTERDGIEREFHRDGSPAGERTFAHDLPTGLWRTWYPDGTPRSEVDFGAVGSRVPRTQRFWHANGRPAAEGLAIAGIREGRWSFWNEDGSPARAGSYRDGKRDGAWTLHDERGAKRAEGLYALGERVGSWTLWDEDGVPHTKAGSEIQSDDQ